MREIDTLGPYELGESGEKSAILKLISFLLYGKSNEKRLAASAIRKLTPKYPPRCQEAVPPLLANLKELGNQVRQYALKALLGLKVPSEAIDLLNNIATTDVADYNRELAARILWGQHKVKVPITTKPSKGALPGPELTGPRAKPPVEMPEWMVNKTPKALGFRGIEEKMVQEGILILAITRMHSGICLAGIDLKTHRRGRFIPHLLAKGIAPETCHWVRPVKSYGTLQPNDLIDASGKRISNFDAVRMNLLSWHPKAPHIEDWITDFDHKKLVILNSVPEIQRGELLDSLLDNSPNEVLQYPSSRSLCLIKPEEIKKVIFDPGVRYGKYEVRIIFNFAGQDYLGTPRSPGLPCTDLKFRALGKRLLGKSTHIITLSGKQLKELFHLEKVYFTIGLGRQYKGKNWPMVLGFHIIPDYIAYVDFGSL